MRTSLISIYKLILNGSSDAMIGDAVCTLIAAVALLYPESQISESDLKTHLNRPLRLCSEELEDMVTIEVMRGPMSLAAMHVWESKSKITGDIQHILSERRQTEIEQILRQGMGSIAVLPKRTIGATKVKRNLIENTAMLGTKANVYIFLKAEYLGLTNTQKNGLCESATLDTFFQSIVSVWKTLDDHQLIELPANDEEIFIQECEQLLSMGSPT